MELQREQFSSVDGKSTLSSGGIGSINTGNFWSGTIQEVIVYNTDQSANRTAFEANIGETYGIDLPSGVDTGVRPSGRLCGDLV